MIGVVGVLAFLTVLAMSLAITRLATTALILTGLSEEAARFQARSAFTGTGFTTSEAESVVNHPVRRRIIAMLMVVRSAGLVTIIISLILSFGDADGQTDRLFRLLGLLAGVLVLAGIASSKFLDRVFHRVIHWALRRWTDLDTRDYMSLLKLSGEYRVMEVQVQQGDWLAGKTLHHCRLSDEGVTVLGIYRDGGGYVGAPKGNTEIDAGDTLLLYGRSKTLRELDRRRADAQGEAAHRESVREQQQHERQQDDQEQEHRHRKEKQASGQTGN